MIIISIKDSGSPSEDAEIVLSIYNPNKDHLATYRVYDIKQMGENFRSILCLKSRYGESNAADCCFFNGKVNVWQELPKPTEIYDYSKYSIDKKEEVKEDVTDNKKMKFTI